MFDLTNMEYVLGIWFVPGNDMDWMAGVFKNKDDSRWHIQYRFRYYHPEGSHPFDGKDKKRSYAGTMDGGTEEDHIEHVVGIVFHMTKAQFATRDGDYLQVKGPPEKCMELLKMMPWAHMKMVPREEYERTHKKGR